jgi:Tfp pilus assembly protein PilF
MTVHRLALASALVALLSACASSPPKTSGLSEVIDRPAESALFTGIREYDDGQYADAEASLKKALESGLSSPRDRSTAYKLLAFIYCTSNRTAECEDAFKAARQANPTFALSRTEAGHPVWGPVFRRVAPNVGS